ncbi:MAG TPA: hypothetical protein VIV11_08630 [Kofleriaceae bacterium]
MEHAKAAIDVVRRIRPGELPFNDPAFRALFEFAETTDAEGLAALIRALAAELANPNPFRASCIAITCGTLVEWGASPSIAGLAIVDRLRSAAAGSPPDLDAMTMFDQAAMAHLCRSVELRVAARKSGAGEIDDAPFTSIVLGLVDDLELLVLAPAHAKGYRARLEAIKTNAHLFTLLQGAVLGDLPGEPVDPKVIAVATGEQRHSELLTDHQRFRFDDWSALVGPNQLASDLRGFLPVDASPSDIRPLRDGRRVVLLGEPQLGGRSWDSNFFANVHDALRSSVVIVERLTPAAVRDELANILAQVSDRAGTA